MDCWQEMHVRASPYSRGMVRVMRSFMITGNHAVASLLTRHASRQGSLPNLTYPSGLPHEAFRDS